MSGSAPPLAFVWRDGAMVPLHPRLAAKHFGEGEVVTLEVREERSSASHRHYFASIKNAHDSLPAELAERFPTPEALRKYALIRAGYRDERSIVCASKAEAQRLAAFIRPMDDFAYVTTDGAVVAVYTAKSQSVRAMPKGEFQRSKDAVLEFIASLIGTSKETLEQQSEAA
jgi:hypothetical protein